MFGTASPNLRRCRVGLLVAVLQLIAQTHRSLDSYGFRRPRRAAWCGRSPVPPRRLKLPCTPGTPAGVLRAVTQAVFSVWRPMNAGLTDLDVRVLAIGASDASVLFAATPSGVSRTADGVVAKARCRSSRAPGGSGRCARRQSHVLGSGLRRLRRHTSQPIQDYGWRRVVAACKRWSSRRAGALNDVINPVSATTLYASVFNRVFKSSTAV